MEFLLYQALNSLICISSAKEISAWAMTHLGKYGYYCFHFNKEIEAQRIKRFTQSLKAGECQRQVLEQVIGRMWPLADPQAGQEQLEAPLPISCPWNVGSAFFPTLEAESKIQS